MSRYHRISIHAYVIEQQSQQCDVPKNEMSLMSFMFKNIARSLTRTTRQGSTWTLTEIHMDLCQNCWYANKWSSTTPSERLLFPTLCWSINTKSIAVTLSISPQNLPIAETLHFLTCGTRLRHVYRTRGAIVRNCNCFALRSGIFGYWVRDDAEQKE
jgi:hypothetical protein